MSHELKIALAVTVLLSAAIGVIAALLTPLPVPDVIVAHSDPAAYQVAEVLEEARRIVAEAADDAG